MRDNSQQIERIALEIQIIALRILRDKRLGAVPEPHVNQLENLLSDLKNLRGK